MKFEFSGLYPVSCAAATGMEVFGWWLGGREDAG